LPATVLPTFSHASIAKRRIILPSTAQHGMLNQRHIPQISRSPQIAARLVLPAAFSAAAATACACLHTAAKFHICFACRALPRSQCGGNAVTQRPATN